MVTVLVGWVSRFELLTRLGSVSRFPGPAAATVVSLAALEPVTVTTTVCALLAPLARSPTFQLNPVI